MTDVTDTPEVGDPSELPPRLRRSGRPTALPGEVDLRDVDTPDVDIHPDGSTATRDTPVVVAEPPPEVVDSEDPAPPAIDPRFRVRRTEVRRRLRRRRRRIWGSVAAVVLLALATLGFLQSPLADVDVVRVRGAGRLTPTEVIEASGVQRGQALYSVDAGAVEARLEEVPWIERAHVAVRWPSAVDLRVVERPVVAVVVRGEEELLVARGGVVTGRAPAPDPDAVSIFVDVGSPDGGLAPRVEVPGDESVVIGERVAEPLALALEMVSAIPSRFRPLVTAASVDEEGEVRFTLGLAAEVRLGTPDDAGTKFASLETMLGGGVVLDCITELDLRVPADPRITRAYRC